MRAVRFNGEALEEVSMPKPRPGRGEALVKVEAAGICSTDLEIIRGYMDFRGVPGHEFVGTVISPIRAELAGRRVVGEINVPCRRCPICRGGLGKHCPNRSILGIHKRNGAFAEYLTLPTDNLHLVPDNVSDEEAVFTELLAAACEIPVRVKIDPSSRVAILGDGRLAAMAAQVVSLKTKRVRVFGMNVTKLSVFKKMGFSAGITGKMEGLRRRFDVVVECTGEPKGLTIAARLVRPQGTIVLKSTYEGKLSWNPAPVVVDEITVIGSRCGPFDTALELLTKRKVNVLPFLTAAYPFARWREAFRRAGRRDSFKVLLTFPPS